MAESSSARIEQTPNQPPLSELHENLQKRLIDEHIYRLVSATQEEIARALSEAREGSLPELFLGGFAEAGIPRQLRRGEMKQRYGKSHGDEKGFTGRIGSVLTSKPFRNFHLDENLATAENLDNDMWTLASNKFHILSERKYGMQGNREYLNHKGPLFIYGDGKEELKQDRKLHLQALQLLSEANLSPLEQFVLSAISNEFLGIEIGVIANATGINETEINTAISSLNKKLESKNSKIFTRNGIAYLGYLERDVQLVIDNTETRDALIRQDQKIAGLIKEINQNAIEVSFVVEEKPQTDELLAAQAEIENLKTLLAEAEATIAEKEAIINKHATKITELEAKIHRLTTELQELDEKEPNAELNEAITKLNDEITRLKAELEAAKRSKQLKGNAELQEDLAHIERQRDRMAARLREVSETNEGLTQKNEELRLEVEKMKAEASITNDLSKIEGQTFSETIENNLHIFANEGTNTRQKLIAICQTLATASFPLSKSDICDAVAFSVEGVYETYLQSHINTLNILLKQIGLTIEESTQGKTVYYKMVKYKEPSSSHKKRK